MNTPSLAYKTHDHQHCIDDALTTAEALCRNRGVKLTPMRQEVLRLIWQSHKPLGAYTVLSMLSENSERNIAPPTVYRALDFLVEQAFVHKIHSLNAFVGCSHPKESHQNHFLICSQCDNAMEFGGQQLTSAIQTLANSVGFSIQEQSLEILGQCQRCQNTYAKDHP